MRELSGLSHAEIAVALGTTSGAAKQAIFEARTALLEFAEGRAAPCEEIRRRLSERDGRVLRNRRLRSHLRDCSSCDAFAAAIGQRRADLRAIAPALPLVASAGLLARIARGGGDQGMSGLAAGGAAAGAAGKFGGAALISKSLATIAAALTTVAGVAGLHSTLDSAGHASHHVQGSPTSGLCRARGVESDLQAFPRRRHQSAPVGECGCSVLEVAAACRVRGNAGVGYADLRSAEADQHADARCPGSGPRRLKRRRTAVGHARAELPGGAPERGRGHPARHHELAQPNSGRPQRRRAGEEQRGAGPRRLLSGLQRELERREQLRPGAHGNHSQPRRYPTRSRCDASGSDDQRSRAAGRGNHGSGRRRTRQQRRGSGPRQVPAGTTEQVAPDLRVSRPWSPE